MSLLEALGKTPSGARQQRILHSPNYRDGAFQNLLPTEVLKKGTSMWKLIRENRHKPTDNHPPKPIPSIRTDLNTLPKDAATIVWFGHSSYLLQLGITRILVDPVFSGNASPVTLFAKAFPGSDIYKPQDMPTTLDAILLTHDHYDHLDYKTIQQLAPRTNHFYTSLGVGAHLEYWGIPAAKITELDWWESVDLDPTGRPISPGTGPSSASISPASTSASPSSAIISPSSTSISPSSPGIDTSSPSTPNLRITATPARHFSGRTFRRGKTLWSGFVLKTPNPENAVGASKPLNLFLGGDSGYGPHFQSIGEKFGPFELAILECGQYGIHWPSIHMFPEQTAQAAIYLKAQALFPVHWGKFSLSLHPWNEPIRRVKAAADAANLPITTPKIGQPFNINHNYPIEPWYEIG
jgi:L-ascorbate metabolism protein UlaG (beta-lactamase superfamily)